MLQPQLENYFSQPRFLWLTFESKLYIIISVLSNTLPPSSNPGLCPDLETWPLPGFHLPISRHISHHLPPGISCIPGCPSAGCQTEPLAGLPGSVPALPAGPFLPPGRSRRCPAGSRGAGADSEPVWEPEPLPALLPALLHLPVPGPGRDGRARGSL